MLLQNNYETSSSNIWDFSKRTPDVKVGGSGASDSDPCGIGANAIPCLSIEGAITAASQ